MTLWRASGRPSLGHGGQASTTMSMARSPQVWMPTSHPSSWAGQK